MAAAEAAGWRHFYAWRGYVCIYTERTTTTAYTHLATYLPIYGPLPIHLYTVYIHAAAVPPYHGAPQHDTKHTMDTSCGTPWNTSTARTSLGNDPSTSLYLSLFSVTLTSFMVSFTLSPFLPRLPTVRPSIRPFVRLSTFPSFLSPLCLRFFLLFCSLSLSLSLNSFSLSSASLRGDILLRFRSKVKRSKVIFSSRSLLPLVP